MIDAHLHFWDEAHATHDWPEDIAAPLRRGFTPDDLDLPRKQAGIHGVILMQSRNDFAESLYFSQLAAQHDFIGALVGWVDLTEPDKLDPVLDTLGACGKLRGVRHLINFEPDPNWLFRDRVQHAIARLAERSIVFDVVPNDAQRFEAVLTTAERHPGLSVVIDHMGRPPVGKPLGEWGVQIARAANLPNVAIKLSVGLDVLRGWQWEAEALRPYADHVLDRFGPDRVMAASNWPVVLASAASYGAAWQTIKVLVDGLAAGDREAVLGRTAARLFAFSGMNPGERFHDDTH